MKTFAKYAFGALVLSALCTLLAMSACQTPDPFIPTPIQTGP